jgi:hypothetical protein
VIKSGIAANKFDGRKVDYGARDLSPIVSHARQGKESANASQASPTVAHLVIITARASFVSQNAV